MNCFPAVAAEQEVATQKARDTKPLTPQHHSFTNALYLDKHAVRGKPKNVSLTHAVYMRVHTFPSIVIVQVQMSEAKALHH